MKLLEYQRMVKFMVFICSIASAADLTYSTYLRDGFTPAAIATDASGNVLVAGAQVIDPLTSQLAMLIAKLNPQGTQYLYTRIISGSVGDLPAGIAVDATGNAYITGTAFSPDFPVTAGPQPGTLPGPKGTRAFVIKLDPQGSVVFSAVIGSVNNRGQAIAVTPQGEIVISGMSDAGFTATPGAYSVPDTSGRPYLMKLDSTGSKVLFSATGIGGSALALDAAGNIYMAGSTLLTDYPTTPGAFQPVIKRVLVCFGLCQITFPGTNQYVTKVDASASKLIYSTGVAGNGQTTNRGLAVDSSGNAYLTGVTYANYPYTVADPGAPQVRPFLTKLDAAGANNLYSVPVGGAGVTIGPQGDVFVGGSYDNMNLGIPVGLPPSPLPPGIAALPQACNLSQPATTSQAYVSRVDSAGGNVLATVLIDGSALVAQGVAMAGDSKAWIAGATTQADTPITPGAIAPAGLKPGKLPGAYLGQADLSQAAAAPGPHISCVLDGANLSRVSATAPNQILTLFGTGLGPDNVSVAFDGLPGTVLYASPAQINVAVPYGVAGKSFTEMHLLAGGVQAAPRVLPVTARAPNLFGGPFSECQRTGFLAVAVNQDGSLNSCAHPAKLGSVVSFFLNGIGGDVNGNGMAVPPFPGSIPVAVRMNSWSAEVTNVALANDFVWRVDVRVPTVVDTRFQQAAVSMVLEYPNGDVDVGPLVSNGPVLFWVGP
jgi:uncharacterized protein (TIGR03437 family)